MEDELIEKTYAYYFQRAQDEYNDALRHYKEESEEVKKAQKTLFEKKKALDEHPLVQAYLKAYKAVREVYEEIQQTLFEPFHTAYQCKEKK